MILVLVMFDIVSNGLMVMVELMISDSIVLLIIVILVFVMVLEMEMVLVVLVLVITQDLMIGDRGFSNGEIGISGGDIYGSELLFGGSPLCTMTLYGTSTKEVN